MADRRQISAANAILVTLSSLAAAFQLCGLILTYLILEKRRLQMVGFQIAHQYDIAVARLRNAPIPNDNAVVTGGPPRMSVKKS